MIQFFYFKKIFHSFNRIKPIQKGEYCDLEVRYLPGKYPLMLFGDAFMRKYTVIYDKE